MTNPKKFACQSVGTKQCAAICLSHSSLIALGDCPEVSLVWTPEAIMKERKRRPNGPLKLSGDRLEPIIIDGEPLCPQCGASVFPSSQSGLDQKIIDFSCSECDWEFYP